LIEVLVVIVVFLIGILAIAQVFPKGFRIIDMNRRASVSSAIAREEIERLKAHPDRIPEEIAPINVDGAGVSFIDPTQSPLDFAPIGTGIDVAGNLMRNIQVVGQWPRYAGANHFRRVIGETQQISAPRVVGTGVGYYGSLISVEYGPIEYSNNLTVYGNDMLQRVGLPQAADKRDDSEYFVTDGDSNLVALNLPSGESDRYYRVSFTAYVNVGGSIIRKEFSGLGPVQVTGVTSPTLGVYPLFGVTAQSLIPAYTLASVDLPTVRDT